MLMNDPFDVDVFPGQRARLYPRQNLADKRVFAAPQCWDWRERAALARDIAASKGPYYFVDAGANVGLYCLAVRSLCGERLRALAVEPDPINVARMRFNLAASGVADAVQVAPVALSDAEGALVIVVSPGNRGRIETHREGPGERVSARPLLALMAEAGFPRIDALKIDIEGMEEPVLSAFLRDADPVLWPKLVLIEAGRGEETEALARLRSVGYVETGRTRLNVMLVAPQQAAGGQTTEVLGATHGEA